jgi:hypothetical protein
MANGEVLDIDASGEEDEKDAQRLEGQVRQLEEVLAQLTQLLEVDRPMREQLMVIEAVGKAAVRLGALLRLQKQMKYMIFEVEDRIQRRKLAEERLYWSQSH